MRKLFHLLVTELMKAFAGADQCYAEVQKALTVIAEFIRFLASEFARFYNDAASSKALL